MKEDILDNQQEIIEIQNKLMSILSSSTTDESEIIKILDNKTLDLSLKQIKALILLKSYNNTYLNNFIKDYLEFKKYNHAFEIILKGIEKISLIDFIKGRLKFNINLSK